MNAAKLSRAGVSIFVAGALLSGGARADDPVPVPSSPPFATVGGHVYHASELQFRASVLRPFPEARAMVAFKVGDFNGDLIADILGVDEAGDSLWIAYGDGRGGFRQGIIRIDAPFPAARAKVGDTDGDGCADLAAPLAAGMSGRFAFAETRCGPEMHVREQDVFLPPFPTRDFLLADYTGDGRDDVVMQQTNYAAWSVSAMRKGSYYELLEHTPDPADRYELLGVGGAWQAATPMAVGRRGGANDFWIQARVGEPDLPPPAGGRPWAKIPVRSRVEAAVVGDFNGDGVVDVIATTGPVGGWWALLGLKSFGVEVSIASPFAGESRGQLFAADFNGDGLDDLLRCDVTDGVCRMALSVPGPAVAGAELIADDGVHAVSGPDGGYAIPLVASGKHAVALLSREGEANRRVFTTNAGRRTKPINLLAPPALQGIGAALGSGPGPYVCVGYDALSENKWSLSVDCPPGYAYYSVDPTRTNTPPPAGLLVAGKCCRLPYSDILTGEQELFDANCPPDSVGTGAKWDLACRGCAQQLRCSKINIAKYRLGPPLSGVDLGVSMSASAWTNRIDTLDVPIAVRFGLLRESYDGWNNHGCVGAPIGSLLVARDGSRCNALTFRELQYRFPSEHGPAGAPVTMYPDCKAIENIYDPRTGCAAQP